MTHCMHLWHERKVAAKNVLFIQEYLFSQLCTMSVGVLKLDYICLILINQ